MTLPAPKLFENAISLSDKRILSGLSPRLKELLTTGSDADAKAEISMTPSLLAEVRAALPAIRRRAQEPAGAEGVRDVIGARFGIYPQPARTDGELAAFWSDYADALEDVSRGALEAGMRAWVKNPESQFLPKPGELRALARSTENPSAIAYNRAYYASLEANTPPGEVKARETEPKDVAAVQAMLAEFQAAMKAKRPPPTIARPTHGALAEGRAITPQMIALRERQGYATEAQA